MKSFSEVAAHSAQQDTSFEESFVSGAQTARVSCRSLILKVCLNP